MSRYEVIGDWGTSRLRLFRLEGGQLVSRRDGPGIGMVGDQAETAFAEAIGPWLDDGPPDAIRLCGMVGARDGWIEAPYADCPADEDDWRAAAVQADWRRTPLDIMAGLACTGADGVPDVMRGEETQIFGALARDPALSKGRHLFILPGTHSKWALVEDGRVAAFRTIPTGELFALLRDHSTLGPKDDAVDSTAEATGFTEGLHRAAQGHVLTNLFAARAMRLRADRSADWALGYLSGLLIGCEIAESRALMGEHQQMILIGDDRLTRLYAQALAAQGLAGRCLDGDACVLAGLGYSGD